MYLWFYQENEDLIYKYISNALPLAYNYNYLLKFIK